MPSLSASANFRLARSGSSRSSRNRSTNSSRLSTNRNASSLSPSPGSRGLLHAHVPFDQPANLTLGIAAPDHPRDEVVVLLLGVAVLLRAERDHRKQVFDLREYPLFDDFADFLIRGPARVPSAVLGPRPQGELDDFVAEVLWVRDPGGLFDLGQLLVEELAIEHLAGVGILEVLVLDPGIGIIDVAIEQVLAVIGIGFEIGFLNLVADEFRIARHQLGFDEFKVALFDFVGELLAAD